MRAYVYEKEVLDKALAAQDGIKIYGSKAKLYALRHQLNRCRVADREFNSTPDKVTNPNFGFSIYDKLAIRNPVPAENGEYVMIINNNKTDFRGLTIVE